MYVAVFVISCPLNFPTPVAGVSGVTPASNNRCDFVFVAELDFTSTPTRLPSESLKTKSYRLRFPESFTTVNSSPINIKPSSNNFSFTALTAFSPALSVLLGVVNFPSGVLHPLFHIPT